MTSRANSAGEIQKVIKKMTKYINKMDKKNTKNTKKHRKIGKNLKNDRFSLWNPQEEEKSNFLRLFLYIMMAKWLVTDQS